MKLFLALLFALSSAGLMAQEEKSVVSCKTACSFIKSIEEQNSCLKKCFPEKLKIEKKDHSCKSKCEKIKGIEPQKACYNKCYSLNVLKLPLKHKCSLQCEKIEDEGKRKACYNSCKKEEKLSCKDQCSDVKGDVKKKLCLAKCSHSGDDQLKSCEKTDSQTITCADGVYIKSQAVNNAEGIKEVIDHVPADPERGDNGASYQ